MAYLGMLTLGAFVGAVLAVGLSQIQGVGGYVKVVGFLLASALTGGVFTFIDYLGGPKLGGAIFAYPGGLLLGVVWYWVNTEAVPRIMAADASREDKILGWGHVVFAVVLTVIAAALVLPPAFHEAWKLVGQGG